MEDNKNQRQAKPAVNAQESLRRLMQEGKKQPPVDVVMMNLKQARAENEQLKIQLMRAGEQFRDMQLRLLTNEFQNRLEFLWRVMFTEGTEKLFGKDFINKCAEEFKDMMFLAPPKEEEKKEEENDA